MSQPSSVDPSQPYVRRPRADVYTTMLVISFIALVVGCVALGAEMQRYDWKFRPSDLPAGPS